MKEKLKELYKVFTAYYLWFILGVLTFKLIDLAQYLMTYPNDIAFYTGLFIYTICIGAIGYAIYSTIFNNLKKEKDEN